MNIDRLKRIKILCLLSFCLLFVILFSSCLTTAPNWGEVRGMIVDTAYEPISGGTAVIGSDLDNTDSGGNYSLARVTSGTKIVILSRSGYTTSYREVSAEFGKTSYAGLAVLAPLDSKITEIDSSGGMVSNTSGSIQLSIPAGALSSSTAIQVTDVPLAAAPYPPPVGYQFIAVIVYLSPSDTALASSAILSIPNVTGLVDGASVAFYRFNLASLEWQVISEASGEVDAAAGTINAHITTFGWLAAIVPVAPSAGEVVGTITDNDTGNPIPYANVWSSCFSTVADSNGNYILSNLPTNEAIVEAVASGYDHGSKAVIVEGGSSVAADLALDPLTTGLISGYVLRQSNSAVVAGARVITADGIETTTDTDGSFLLGNVPAGTTHIYGYANGYVYNSTTEVVYAGETTTTIIYLVKTSEAVAWTDDFESDKGWSVSSSFAEVTWQRVADSSIIRNTLAPIYVTLPDYASTLGKLPSAHGGSYSFWYGQEKNQAAQGCYIAVQASNEAALSGGTSKSSYPYNYGYLVSPGIDITGYGYATLSFWTWWEIEGVNAATGYDQMKVQISTDGGASYTDLAVLNPYSDPNVSREAFRPYSSGGYNQAGIWVKHSFDLLPYVGNVVKIRFFFNSGDELYNGFRGWFIDDFAVSPEAISYGIESRSSVLVRPDKGIINQVKR